MIRFKHRKLLDMDMDGRFEGNSTTVHIRNARDSIERLREYGREFWNEVTVLLRRWEEGCNTHWQFINNFGKQRHIDKNELQCVLREFIAEFEHTKHRLLQMVWGELEDQESNPKFQEIYDWILRVERYCIYAIVSFWLDDKYDESHIKIDIVGKVETDNEGVIQDVKFVTQEEHHCEPMRIPRKYRRASMKLK